MGQFGQGRAQRGDHRFLIGFMGEPQRLFPLPLRFDRLEIGGDGQVHVEHGGLDEAGDRLAGLFRRRAAAGQQALGPLLANDGPDQVVGDEGVAADVPARLQADARVGLADGADGPLIILGELGLGDDVPVGLLAPAGRGDVGIVPEVPAGLRRAPDLVVEARQGLGDFRLDQRAQGAQGSAGAGAQSHERRALFQQLIVGHAPSDDSRIRIEGHGYRNMKITRIGVRRFISGPRGDQAPWRSSHALSA
jgi:hypothetical protein